jgi:sugar (pentulose or hexulose) kinase
MGGHAVGIYTDMAATADRFARTTSRTEPRAAMHRHYQDYVAAYRQAFDQLGGLYQALTPLGEKPFAG